MTECWRPHTNVFTPSQLHRDMPIHAHLLQYIAIHMHLLLHCLFILSCTLFEVYFHSYASAVTLFIYSYVHTYCSIFLFICISLYCLFILWCTLNAVYFNSYAFIFTLLMSIHTHLLLRQYNFIHMHLLSHCLYFHSYVLIAKRVCFRSHSFVNVYFHSYAFNATLLIYSFMHTYC